MISSNSSQGSAQNKNSLKVSDQDKNKQLSSTDKAKQAVQQTHKDATTAAKSSSETRPNKSSPNFKH